MMQSHFLTASALVKSDHHAFDVSGTVVAMPYTQLNLAKRAANLLAARACAPGMIVCIEDDRHEGFITLINRAFTKTQSTYFAYVAQDAFAGRNWLKLALEALGDHQHFLGFNDGKWAGALAGFGLARRSWAVQNYAGQFFYPQYQRHYADAELTLLALQAGVYAYEPNSLVVEVDWDKDTSAVDANDREVFLMRKKNYFEGRVTSQHLLNLIG